MSQSLEEKKRHCQGCRNNFYNYGGNSHTGCCWSLPDAKLVMRWAVGMWTPTDNRERFRKTRVFDCFHGEGPQRDVYMRRLPEHLGGDWADKKEEREAK